MASGAGCFLHYRGTAENDRHAVSVGVTDKAPDRLSGAQHLLVDGVARHLGGALGSRQRHECDDFRSPHAPKLAGIFAVSAFEPPVENLDGDVLRIAEPLFHRAPDQRVQRAELVLREGSQLLLEARELDIADDRHGRGGKRQDADADRQREFGLQPQIMP
jgi:hypothetical protein